MRGFGLRQDQVAVAEWQLADLIECFIRQRTLSPVSQHLLVEWSRELEQFPRQNDDETNSYTAKLKEVVDSVIRQLAETRAGGSCDIGEGSG